MRAADADIRAKTKSAPSDPTKDLDDVVHQRVRLGILTVVHEARRVDFNYLKRTLGLTGGNLSQHLRVLEDAGFIAIVKVIEGRHPRTWVSITRSGRRALRQEIASLKAIVDRVEGLLLLVTLTLVSLVLPATAVGAISEPAARRWQHPLGVSHRRPTVSDDEQPAQVLVSSAERDATLQKISHAVGEQRLIFDE